MTYTWKKKKSKRVKGWKNWALLKEKKLYMKNMMGIIYTRSYNIYKDNQYVVGTEQKGYIKPSSNSQEQEILQTVTHC